MAYYNNEYDTGVIVDEKTGERAAIYTISITLAEYRELVAKAAKNEAARLSNDCWRMKSCAPSFPISGRSSRRIRRRKNERELFRRTVCNQRKQIR